MLNRLKLEWPIFVIYATTILFILFGDGWLADLNAYLKTSLLFVWIFTAMMLAAFSVVRHADALAVKLGEPLGTLILTLSVISIEVITISAVMLQGMDNPTLGRDMMFSVLMIVLNGMVGFSLLIGGIKHHQQSYNLQGVHTFLIVLSVLSILGLVMPNYTNSTERGTFSTFQEFFLIFCAVSLYGVFLLIQTLRHKEFFISKAELSCGTDEEHHHANIYSVPFHAVMLILYMLPIVILSKKLAIIVNFGMETLSLPAALGGFLVAILVLSPEGLSSFKSALQNHIQRSINICLGSALATIGLTIPAVLIIGFITQEKIVLGLDRAEEALLWLTIIVSAISFASGRSNIIQGVVHLILFAAYLMLIFD